MATGPVLAVWTQPPLQALPPPCLHGAPSTHSLCLGPPPRPPSSPAQPQRSHPWILAQVHSLAKPSRAQLSLGIHLPPSYESMDHLSWRWIPNLQHAVWGCLHEDFLPLSWHPLVGAEGPGPDPGRGLDPLCPLPACVTAGK